MKTLEITKENAIKAYKSANTKGRKLLENLFGKQELIEDITERVKTFEDACSIKGISVSSILSDYDTEDEAAYKKLKTIIEVLNEGWQPDWKNSSEYKYYSWFKFKSGFGFSHSDYVCTYTITSVGSRLCFKTRELAEYAGKQFEDIYKDYLTITK
jgi:hypothetical protein